MLRQGGLTQGRSYRQTKSSNVSVTALKAVYLAPSARRGAWWSSRDALLRHVLGEDHAPGAVAGGHREQLHAEPVDPVVGLRAIEVGLHEAPALRADLAGPLVELERLEAPREERVTRGPRRRSRAA